MKRYIRSSNSANPIHDPVQDSIHEEGRRRQEAFERAFPGRSVELHRGMLNYDDPRYIQMFNALADLGYTPRKTEYAGWYEAPAMTIDAQTTKLPADVEDIANNLGVGIYRVTTHPGKTSHKIKFCLGDEEFESWRDIEWNKIEEEMRSEGWPIYRAGLRAE